MPYDGSGNYVPPSAPTFPAVSGTPISSSYYNSVINDISLALNNVITRDGQGKPSAAINWNGQNLTSVNSLSATTATFNTLAVSTTANITGSLTAGSLLNTPILWPVQGTKTLVSDAITVTAADFYYVVATEGGTATDTLSTINGGTSGQILILRSFSAAQTITINNSANIKVPYDIVITSPGELVALIYDNAAGGWVPIAVPDSLFTSTVQGTVPASGGGTTNFLRADGSWAAPATVSLNALTMNNSGAGAASGTTFDGSVARTISYNTIGAPSLTGTGASGTWGISISGNAATATSATSATSAGSVTNSLTVNNGGAGAASGTTYNGSAARTISYNTIGAQPAVPNVQSAASTATLTPDGDDNDICVLTAQAANLTIAAPSGSPTQGRGMVLRIKDNGTSRTISWNAIYRAIGVTLPTATTVSKILYVGMIYNSTDNKWDVTSIAQEA